MKKFTVELDRKQEEKKNEDNEKNHKSKTWPASKLGIGDLTENPRSASAAMRRGRWEFAKEVRRGK